MVRGGPVELILFDVAGQSVATLASGHREPGTYTARWDGTDNHGASLASGIYLYRLRIGGKTAVRRLLFLR